MDFQVIRATREFAFDMGYVHSYSWQKAYTGIIPDEIIKTFTPENRAKIFLDVLENPLEEYYLFNVYKKLRTKSKNILFGTISKKIENYKKPGCSSQSMTTAPRFSMGAVWKRYAVERYF